MSSNPEQSVDVARRPGLRVVVAGGSVSLYLAPLRHGRDDGNYGEVLPGLLAPHGIEVDVRHTGKWFDLINELRRRYETAVRNHFPDVLVLNYGMGECQYNLVPTWLTRHVANWDISSRRSAQLYRDHVVPTMWRQLRRYQQRAAPTVLGQRSYRLPPKRFRFEMERVITMARGETGCLVLVLDCDPPGPRFTYWMPGMEQRWSEYQQVLTDLVTGLDDPLVRLVPASKTLEHLGLEQGLPDSIHRSAHAHRLTAELLAAEILDWHRTESSG